MTGHPSCNGVNCIFNFNSFLLKEPVKFMAYVLSLSNCEAVTRYYDDLSRITEKDRGIRKGYLLIVPASVLAAEPPPPNTPTITLRSDLFIALHIRIVRIVPAEPTRIPPVSIAWLL